MTKKTTPTITIQPPVAIATLKPGKYAVAQGLDSTKTPFGVVLGLRLIVRGNSRAWEYRYTMPGAPKESTMSLGPFSSANSLKTAIENRDRMAALVRDGTDPKQHRQDTVAATRLEQIRASEMLSYRDYVMSLKADLPTKPRSRAAAIRYGIDTLGEVADLKPAEITFTHLVAKLTPVWTQGGVARESVKYIARYLRLAEEDQHMVGHPNWSNPCSMKRLKRAIDAALPDIQHRKAVAFDAVPELLTKLRQGRNDMGSPLTYLIVELIVLTALRSTEVTRLLWSYVDSERSVIRIPRAMMKGQMAGADKDLTHFEVPLTPSMVKVLNRAKFLAPPKTDSDPIFPSKASKKDRFFDDGTILDVLETLGFRQADAPKGEKETIHGFRSCFAGWANANQMRTSEGPDGQPVVAMQWSRSEVQMCLAHVEKDETIRAYARTMPVEPRRAIMLAWNAAVEPKVVDLDAQRPAPAPARRRAGGGVY